MQQLISDNMQDTKLQTILLGSFALLGLLLSAVGIYGLTAYLVTQRTHEIGLRVALGAQRRDILQLVVGRGSRLAFAGVASGVFLAFALTRLLSKELFGVTATDPVVRGRLHSADRRGLGRLLPSRAPRDAPESSLGTAL